MEEVAWHDQHGDDRATLGRSLQQCFLVKGFDVPGSERRRLPAQRRLLWRVVIGVAHEVAEKPGPVLARRVSEAARVIEKTTPATLIVEPASVDSSDRGPSGRLP